MEDEYGGAEVIQSFDAPVPPACSVYWAAFSNTRVVSLDEMRDTLWYVCHGFPGD